MTESKPHWQNLLAGIAKNPDSKLAQILESARTITLPAQQPVFHPGSPCQQYLLLTEGRVCVYLTAENGREVTLYHVQPGHSCVLTTSCLLGQASYPAAAVTETEVTALVIDSATFQNALDNCAEFRRFVFANLSHRLAEVMRRMEEVTFGDIDQRLAALLLTFSNDSGQRLLNVTHQALAMELGTAREVVSRHLKRFEARGWLQLSRGAIELADKAELIRVSNLRE